MSDEGKKRRAARYKQYVANKNTTANKNAGEKKSTLRFPRMTAEELNSYGGDNTDVKGYDYANRPIYADEVANHPERKKIFKNIVDKRVVADASEPFAKLEDGNIVGIPNDNSAPKNVGKVYNNDKTNREKYTRTPLQEGYNREKALEKKKNKLREEYSTTLKPEIDTEVDDEVINAINEKRFIQDEYNRQKAERERLIAGNNKNPRWYEGRVGLVNTDMIDKANELSWKQIEGYDLDNADQRALAILKLSLPYSRARQSYVNRAKTISDRANQQGKGSMWQGVVDNLADFTGLEKAFSAIEMGKSARHYIQAYERFSKIYNNSDQAREKAIQSLNKEDRANLEVFTAVQQVLAGNENELSYWYQAGQVTGDMLPFMLQLGASSTIVKGAGKLLRGGAKKIAEKQMAKGISTALLNTVVSPATQRAKNEEYANIRLFENRDITAKDRAKVYGQQAIENLTETVGVPFAKLGVQGTQRLFKGIGAKMLEKPMINRTFGKITKFAERPQQWIKIANKLGNNPVSKFLKDNLFFGGFGEEAFEEVEGALGNTVLGYLFDDEEMKQEFSNFWQADNLSVLALGLAPMTMFPLSFGISNAVVSHRDAKAYQQAREQLLGALRQAGLGNKKIIDGLEGKIIEGKPHEVIETLSALRRAAQGAQNEKDIDEAIYNYIAGARRLSEQRNELNAQLQQMNNAQRKEYVDNIIENIHRQQKNNILYQGIKNGYYQELQDPQNGKKEKYICEVYNKNGTSIGFITDKEQDDNGNVLFTIVDGLGQVQRMTLDDIYRQAEGGEDANNPIVFTKVRDILDYLYEQAGEDEELRADIQTRNLLQDAIKRGADGSNVINVARLNDGGIMFLTDINEQAGTVTGLVQTQDGAYQPQQISLSEVAEAKEQNVEDLIDNTANIFNANIEADGILPQNTMPYYSSDLQANNKKEEIKTTPEETEKQRTTEEKESAFTVGDKVAVSVDKGNIDSYGDYGEYDGKEYEVKGVRGNQVILDIDGELRPININKQGVTLTKVEGQEEKTEAKEQGTTETEKAKEETETQKQEEKTKSLSERIKSGEILSQNAEETLVDLYSNMSKEDAQEVVNGIIKQTQDRQKQLAKKTINYEDIDKFQQHKKQVRETEKKLAYWNEVKSLFTAPLSQEKEVQSLKSIKEKEGALGQAYSIREYILRNLALGAKFLWNDSENGTKGLGSHLGLREAKEERRNYYAFLNGKDRKAVYPEVYAERLLTDVRENINPNVEFDEVFNEMIDCLSSYSTPTAMMDEAVRMHYEAEDNLTQNDFEKQQQAMIDRAEKREENRIQDELNKQEALSEEDYERMRQGFDEQEKASEIYRSKEITPEQEALLRKPNSSQYQPVQELSAGKDSKNSENREEKGEKNDKEEQLRNELISLLKKAGIEVITDKKQADDVRKKAEEKARDIKTTAGEVYGFTVGGKIYIYTDIATSETPIHEYAHLFVKALKITNKQAWERLKEGLRKEKDLLSYVKNKYKGITDEDVLLSEVFATYAGKAGRERMQTDLKKELSQTKSNVEKMRIIQIFASLRKLLDRFWKMAKAMFEGEVAGVETMSVKDFSDMAMSSLLNGFNPVRVIQDATKNNPKSFGIEEDLDSRIDYQISRRNEEQIEKLLKKNANITDKEIEAFKQYVEHEQPVAQLSMAKWVGNGSVRLPEDKPTVDEALKICRKDKLDPMRYAAPGEIVKEWREKNIDEQEEQRQYLSPDSYPDVLTNKQDLGNGVTVYDVADTRAGQQAVRELMNSHLTVDGRYYNCWCLLYASESTGELSSQAWGYWNNYNGTQKKVAFKDGKIVSFCASSSSHSEWWDLSDKSHGDKIPVEGKIPNDKLGRSSLMEVDMQTGKATPVGRKYSGNKKNGLYREWNKDDVLVLSENYKGRKRNGLCEYWYSNGQMMKRINYKDDKFNGLFERWYDNGQMMERSNYKDGKFNGLFERWYDNGQMMIRSNWKDGERNGLYEYWYSNGQMKERSNWKDGKFNGLYEEWYSNGQMMIRSNWKDGERNGLYEEWYSNGQILKRSNWKDGERIENLPITEDKGAPAPRWEDENERIKEDRSVKNITESESKRKGMLGVVLDALRKAIGKENVITDSEEAQRVIDEVNGRVRPEMTEDVFYSNAERSVENISQDKATPEQWLKMIEKQGGLKAGEDKWLGLSDWLKDSKEKTLTKQDVLDFINENKIQIEEVTYADLEDRKAFNELQEEFDTIPFDDAEYMWEQADSRIAEFYEEMEEKYGEDYLDSMNPSERITEETLLDERERWDAEHAPDDNEAAFNAMVDKYGDDFEIAFGQNGGQLYVNNGEAAAHFLGVNPSDEVRLGYTTEGLSNKREIALTVPTIESWNEWDEIHFGDAGNGRAVAWIRFGETTDKDGKRVLVIDEIQSKRHQEGREKGYKKDGTQDAETKAYIKMVEAQASYDSYVSNLAKKYDCERDDIYSYANDAEVAQVKEYMKAVENTDKAYEKAYEENHGIPDAPFEKNWHEVAMKRMLRYAAENGYDKVAWTTGEQQAERYNIGNVVESIIYYDYPARKDKEGRNTKKIVIRSHNNEPMSMRVNNEGLIIDAGSELRGKNLMEVLGKELAAKILNGDGSDITLWDESMDNPAKEINDNGLRIGGEGMKGFYDQMLPRFMDKYGKKWGVKTQDVELPEVEEAGRIMHSVDVTDEMRRSVMEGQPLFQRESSEEVNKRFNEELQQQIDGRLPKDHTYQLGLAGSVLQSAGVRALPIELRASRLTDKSMQENHPFELSDIKNLPNAIQEPIMVFDSANTAGRKVILTEIESKGNNFVVVLSAELKGNKISVNRIRSLYPKDSVQGIIDWINAGNLLKYADKNKALEWIGKQQSNSADVTNTIKNLDLAAKVLQTFKNPAIIEQKNEKNLKEHRLVGGNSGYVGYSMSKRAEQAREEGRYPKTDFKKVYNISDKTLKALVSAGIIDDNEWHHTSKYGNKTTFYGWAEEKFATIYRLFKKEIDAIVKENQPQPNPYKYTEWTEFSEEFQALPYNVKRDKDSKELQDFLKTHPEDKAKYEENERYNQWQAQAPSPIETTRIVSEKLNKFFDEKDVKFFKTKDGEAYGFTVEGKVYVDERIADASTPIHEYTHLWAEALRKVNPKEWQNIVSLMKKQTHLWDKVKNDYPELKTDDEIADEVLAHYSGERGKKLLDEEYDKIRGNNKMNIFDKAKMLQAINNVREALRKFWKGVADFLGIHFTSAEEVADKVLSDLLEGVNPNQVKSATDNVGTFDSEDADIRFHKSTERVVEKATDKALEEVKDPILKRAYKGILKESTKDKWASFADDYHALRVMEDKVIEEMRKRDPKFRLHHSVYEQQIAAKAATQGQIFLFSQQTFKPLLDKVDKIAKKYNLSQKEVEQFMMFQFYRERTNDVIYNRWRETQDRIDAGRTPNKEYKEEYDAVKKYMGSLTDRERAEAERKANEIFGKIAEEKTFGSLEEMDEEFDQLKTEMYARAAADKYRQQELWDTNNKDGIRGFAGEESMCRTALYQTIAESYFPKEKGNMTTTRLTPDEIIEKFRDMVGKDNVDELNKLSRAVTQFTLDKALETGNITREEYEKYQRQEYYVPLRGWDKDDGEVSVFGNDTSFQSVNPNAKGRTTTADNPLKYMFVIASNQIHDFNEKQAKRSLINFINEYKDIIIGANATSYWSWNDKDNNKVYDVKRPKKNEHLKGTLEFHVMNDSYERVYPKTLKDYTFTFKDGDKTYNMYLPSKYLVKILNKDKQPDGKIIQWLSKGTRFLASMRTSKNPSFVAANFSRDALVVLLLDENRSKEFPHFRKLFLENLSKMQTVWRSEWEEGKAYRGSKMDNDVQKLYNQWVYYGGMSGYSFFLDDIEKEYEKRYKDLQRRSTRSKVVQNVNPFSSRFLDIFNRFSEFTENQVRFAAFRAYLEASEIAGNPLTVQEAVYKSKEATLNFSRSGWGTRTLGKIFPFFNAAMQGIIKLARVLRYNPTRFWGAVSIAVGVGALDAFLSLILGGDDDKKNKYLQINDYVKERNLIIMRAKIPIPQELYIPFTIGVNLMEAYLGKKTVTEAASRIINALGELLPSEVGTSLGALVEYDRVNDRLKMTDHPFNTIISALAPGIVQPISDFNRNRDFMDRPILSKEPKEEGYNKKIAQAGRYDEYKTYKVFQDAAFYYNNIVSIMTKFEPISWDREYYETLVGEGNKMAKKNGEIGKLRTVSPQAMQFFFGQYLPAISNIATKVGDIQAGRKALSGENIPIADRLVVKHDKHASLYKKSSLVYDILDEQPNKKTLKKMKKAADDEHKERYDKAIQDRKTKVVERYNKNKDKLTRLRMEVKLLRIQGAVKNEKKIDELLDKQEEIYDKILRDWNKKE